MESKACPPFVIVIVIVSHLVPLLEKKKWHPCFYFKGIIITNNPACLRSAFALPSLCLRSYSKLLANTKPFYGGLSESWCNDIKKGGKG